MTDNTMHLSVSGLDAFEVSALTKHVPIRHGVSLTVTDLAQVDDEPDDVTDENRARIDALTTQIETIRQAAADAATAAENAKDAADRAYTEATRTPETPKPRIFVQQQEPVPLGGLRDRDIWIRPGVGLLGLVTKVQERAGEGWVDVPTQSPGTTINASAIRAGTHTALATTSGDTALSDPGPVEYPGAHSPATLAALVSTLPAKSRVLVIADTYARAVQGYTSVTERLDQHLASKVIRTNGHASFVLANGTQVEPASEPQTRGRIADLVIVAVSEDEYTHKINRTARKARGDRGMIAAIAHEGSADA